MALSKIDTAAIATDAIEAAQLKSDAISVTDLPDGCVVQVKQAYGTDTTLSTQSSSWSDIVTTTLTPSSSTNKVLVVAEYTTYGGSTAKVQGSVRIIKDTSTNLNTEEYAFFRESSGQYKSNRSSIQYLDSPATTSAKTYKLQLKPTFLAGGNDVTLRGCLLTLYEVVAS